MGTKKLNKTKSDSLEEYILNLPKSHGEIKYDSLSFMNKEIELKLKEMEIKNPSLSNYHNGSYIYNRPDKIGVNFETNQPKYNLPLQIFDIDGELFIINGPLYEIDKSFKKFAEKVNCDSEHELINYIPIADVGKLDLDPFDCHEAAHSLGKFGRDSRPEPFNYRVNIPNIPGNKEVNYEVVGKKVDGKGDKK